MSNHLIYAAVLLCIIFILYVIYNSVKKSKREYPDPEVNKSFLQANVGSTNQTESEDELVEKSELREKSDLNWHKSNAHILLLSKYLKATSINFSSKHTGPIIMPGWINWESALGEDPRNSIDRFIKEGMLAQGDLKEKLDFKFRVMDLQSLLKERNMPISGRKEVLIDRLIQSDTPGMEKLVEGITSLLQCTEKGRVEVEDYLHNENTEKMAMESKVYEYLKQMNFKDASIAVASYETSRVFPRGIGVDWKNHDSSGDVKALENIFNNTPHALSNLSSEQLKILRIAAGMMYLMGTNDCKKWLPSNFIVGVETGHLMDNESAARTFIFHESNKNNIDRYRMSDVVEAVEVLACDDSCRACKKREGKKYKLNEAPELPFSDCTHVKGCRCTLLPVVKEEYIK